MLTDAQIQKAIKSKKTVDLIEGSGTRTGRLVLRCKDGRAHWYFRWFEGEKKRFLRIGRYPSTTLAQAREQYLQQFSPALAEGTPPKKVRTDVESIETLIKAYTDALFESGKDQERDAKQCLTRFMDFVGNDVRANKVTKSDVISFLRPIHKRGSTYMADLMKRYIHACFNWAIKTENDYRGDCEWTFNIKENPAANIASEEKHLSDRFLDVNELRSFWNWLHQNRNTRDFPHTNKIAVMIQILTGQRFIEIARIRHGMIDFDEQTVFWSKTKNGKPHLLPLPPQALILFQSLTPNEHGLYFPSAEDQSKPVRSRTISYMILRYIDQTKAKKFVGRDLRRTWKTLAGKAGVTKDDRDLVQNHSKGDVSSIHYDRYEYLPEKRRAMEIWSAWFDAQIKNPLK